MKLIDTNYFFVEVRIMFFNSGVLSENFSYRVLITKLHCSVLPVVISPMQSHPTPTFPSLQWQYNSQRSIC